MVYIGLYGQAETQGTDAAKSRTQICQKAVSPVSADHPYYAPLERHVADAISIPSTLPRDAIDQR